MKRYISILSLFFILINLSGQNFSFHNLKIEPILINSGNFKSYYQYDLRDNFLYIGRHENNLKLKILDKKSDNIVYNRIDTLSDAMILKPEFYTNKQNSILIVLIEVAAEYSWGQEIIVIKDEQVKHIGDLNCLAEVESGTSVADYCKFRFAKGRILLTFKNVPIICNNEESQKTKRNLKFEIDMNGIRRIY